MNRSWLGDMEEIVGHLRRDSEGQKDDSADWMVVIRPGKVEGWEVVTRWGKTGANRPQEKVLAKLPNKSFAMGRAISTLNNKAADTRYYTVSSKGQPAALAAARLSLSAELRLTEWDALCIRLAAAGLTATSDSTWEARRKGTGTVLFRRTGDRIYASGFIEVEDAESRPLFAAVALVTGGRITNATGDLVDLESWVKNRESDLSQEAAELAAEFGFLPMKMNYAKLADLASTGPWSGLI